MAEPENTNERGQHLTARADSMKLTPVEMRDVLVMLSGASPDNLEAALNFIERQRQLQRAWDTAPYPEGGES